MSKSLYTSCLICPRCCKVNRLAGQRGFCGETAELRLASASIHRGEEPPITGASGSGTIFVSGCNLGCVFCQNFQISKKFGVESSSTMGRIVDSAEFACICLVLQERGAENINIVTGSHAIPAIAEGIDAARAAWLHVPVLWNSSAYESLEALDILKGRVDMYLPDLKTLDRGLAARFFNAPDYPETAAAAILKMMEDRPGQVLVRHLILPGYLESTRQVLHWFAEHAAGRARLSLMSQYTPVKPLGTPVSLKASAGLGAQIKALAAPPEATVSLSEPPKRFLNEQEYQTVLTWLEDFGIDDGFFQELLTSSDWLPDFERANPFSSDLSLPLWHWKAGFL